jgi:hypothetical protein
MTNTTTEQPTIFKWRLFRSYGPWHYAFHQAEHLPETQSLQGYKNWRAQCGAQFTPAAVEEQDEPPQDGPPVCQRCLRSLENSRN